MTRPVRTDFVPLQVQCQATEPISLQSLHVHVADLVQFLEQNDLEVWFDGGWAVDDLLGEQTRPHDDLDVALPHRHVPRLRSLLAARGFREQLRDDTWECNFVLADEHDCRLDVHSYTLTPRATTSTRVEYIGGYDLDENDYHDVWLLCERFGIAMPDEYRKFER